MKRELEPALLEIVLSPESKSEPEAPARRPDGVIIGSLVGFGQTAEPLVDFEGAADGGPVSAVSVVALDKSAIGRAVVLQFVGGDPGKPVILGVLQGPLDAVRAPEQAQGEVPGKKVDVELDGERLVFTAEKEIVLRCGKASITLTRAGKVLIRGAYLLSRSSGVNRIKGGSVQIN